MGLPLTCVCLPLSSTLRRSPFCPTCPPLAIPTQFMGQLVAEDRQGGAEAAGEAGREGSTCTAEFKGVPEDGVAVCPPSGSLTSRTFLAPSPPLLP